MIVGTEIDWTQILVAVVVGLPGTIAAVAAILNRRSLKTPSGPSIGRQVEQANALSAVTLAHSTRLLKRNGMEAPGAVVAVAEAEQEVKPLINGDTLPRGEGYE